MKRTLFILSLTVLFLSSASSQCVYTCGSYVASPITFSYFATSGTTLNSMFLPSADDGTVNVPIGFNFEFYCGSYTSVNVCTNGFIQFDYGTPIYFGNPPYVNPTQLFPDPTDPNGIVALRMDDYDVGAGGSVSYATIGSPPFRQFVVTYDNVPIWYNVLINSPPSPVYTTGQIVLYETTNIIEIHSGSIDLSPNLGTQGIENINGTAGVAVPGRNNSLWSASNSAYQFSPYLPAPPTLITGNTSVCEGTQNSYAVTPPLGASSYSWSYPAGWSGTGTTTAVTATTIAGSGGYITVSATYSCGTSAPALLNINSIPAPVASIVQADPLFVCSGQQVTVTTAGADTFTLNPGNYTGTSSIVIVAGSSTTYSLAGTNTVTGCLSFNNATADITVYPSPTVTVNSGTICLGQTFTISANGANNYFYSAGFPIVTPTASGVYSYSVTGQETVNLCVNAVPAISSLTVIANPSVTINSNKLIICKNETVTLTADGANSYLWNNGLTTTAIAVSPLVNTTYTVTGTNAEGCSKTKNISIIVTGCDGLEEINGQANLGANVYPNPGSGIFHVEYDKSFENAEIEVYNSIGQLILNQKITVRAFDMDLTNFAGGFYYLKTKASSGQQILKIIKE